MRFSNRFRGAAAILLAATGAVAWAVDDSDEPNNDALDATSAGTLGFVRTARVLAVGDEDWYRFHVPAPRASVTVEVAYDTSAYVSDVALELQSTAGDVIATGGLVGVSGPVRAVSGPVVAGDYLVRVRHNAGAAVGNYTLRTYGANDSDEPNDTPDAATFAGNVGFVRTGRVLNFGDDDWYRFTVPAASDPVTVDVAFDASAYSPSLTLDVQTADGGFVASGSPTGGAGTYRAVTPPLDAGDYLVHVRHVGGGAASDYSVQAYTALAVSAPTYIETTVGRLVDEAIDIRGGIPPYSLAVFDPTAAPPGFAFNASTGRMSGLAAPAGRYDFLLTCRDSGAPANLVSTMVTVVVNAKLDVQLGEFTAFPLGKPTSRAIPFTGGTVPYATTVGAGLPQGISIMPGQLEFTGSAQTAGSVPVSMSVVDGAGLADDVSTTAVVCEPLGPCAMAGGDAACGVYFDAVKDSTVTVNVSTARKQPKRLLRAVLLGADGTTPLAANLKAGNGKATLSRFVVPSTGRYYVVVASATGASTTLVASGKIAPPTRQALRAVAFDGDGRARVTVGALAGAALTFSAKPDKSGVVLTVQSLIDPAGVVIPVDPTEVTTNAGRVTFKPTLAESGTWTIVVSQLGGPSTMSCTTTLRQPKKVVYSADD
jgi:hypothetical protein